MDQNLAYLHQVLSNYVEESEAIRDLDQKLQSENNASEEAFVKELSQEQIQMLAQIIDKEMHHANESGDFERGYQLNGIYEQLY